MLRLADNPVLSLRLTLPGSGIWVASLEVDTEETLTGSVELEDDVATYQGTIVRSGVLAGICRVEMVGGAGGLHKDIPARSYRGVAARAILTELLTAAGERLDSTSTASVLATSLSYWTRAGGRAKDAVELLVERLGATWRARANGTVWIGTDTWPKASGAFDAVELDQDAGAGTVLLAPENLALVPGTTWKDRRIGRVEYTVGRSEHLRATIWPEA